MIKEKACVVCTHVYTVVLMKRLPIFIGVTATTITMNTAAVSSDGSSSTTTPVASTQTSQPPPTNILMLSPSSLPSDELRSTSSVLPQSSMPPTVNVGGMQDSGGLSVGIIVAIVIITLLVLVVVLGIVILGIIIVWRRKRTGKLETLSNIWKGSTFSIGEELHVHRSLEIQHLTHTILLYND